MGGGVERGLGRRSGKMIILGYRSGIHSSASTNPVCSIHGMKAVDPSTSCRDAVALSAGLAI